MEEYKWIIITIVCYFAALWYDILKRDKDSQKSPRRFDLVFFLKDNVNRLIFSFLLSITCAVVFWLIAPDVAKVANQDITSLGSIIYAIIGGAPDLIISYAKRKTNFLKQESVDGFKRK
jgi:amino acid transporter